MRKVLLGVMMLLPLIGCGERNKSVVTKEKQPSPEQVACIKSVLDKRLTLTTKFSQMQVEALMAKRSTIALTLAERRTNEGLCTEEAMCYGYEEPTNSLIFESCLNVSEREQTGD